MLFDAAGGVTAKDILLTVCVPVPDAVTSTSGDSVEEAEKLNVVAFIFDT